MTLECSLRRATGLAPLAAFAALAGCGGSGGTGPAATPGAGPGDADAAVDCGADPASCGTVLVGLTDADGDFLSYAVEVQSLRLERADGTTVETLPLAAVVDFAQYVELTEFLSAATVPPGSYVAGSITLNYASSKVEVEVGGEARPAVVLDPGGAPLDVVEMRVELSDSRRLVVAPGVPAVMVVDFDLAASHQVDVDATPVEAVAEPLLVAEIDPVQSKTLRARGPLVAVDLEGDSYEVALRPFALWRGDFGRITVHTDADTVFDVDGMPLTGRAGLEALAALPPATATVARGDLDVAARRFLAREVLAGSSVPGAGFDAVSGVVVARSGNELQVIGATVLRDEGSAVFNDRVTVLLGDQTRVVNALDPGFAGGIEAVSVGQRAAILGTLTGADGEPTLLDAAAGHVRLQRTVVRGTVNEAVDGNLSMSLQRLGRRDVTLFDFAGTGPAGSDADPTDYAIDTGLLDTSPLLPGDPVSVAGFVTAFGGGGEDFEALTVADLGATPGRLEVTWQAPGTATPFVMLGTEGIVPDLSNPDLRSQSLLNRGVRRDLSELPAAPLLLPDGDVPALFAIRSGAVVKVHTDFGSFTDDLAARLDGAALARGLHATGRYADGVFTATRIWVRLD